MALTLTGGMLIVKTLGVIVGSILFIAGTTGAIASWSEGEDAVPGLASALVGLALVGVPLAFAVRDVLAERE